MSDTRGDDIILIGPVSAGKSTTARLLAARRGVPAVSMDDVRWDYYKEIGYTKAREVEIRQAGGFEAVYWYWKPFELHAVERLLGEARETPRVIDFGAGHSVFEKPAMFARARAAVASACRHVIFLLPSPDPDESIRILRGRRTIPPGPTIDWVDYFVRHPCNQELATMKVYTEGHTPQQTCGEIIKRINGSETK